MSKDKKLVETFIGKVRTRNRAQGRKGIELPLDVREKFDINQDVRVTIEAL